MKRYLLLLLISLFSFSALQAKEYVTTQNVNVREGDGEDYPSIGVLKEGTTVDASDVSGVWTKIKYQGKEGYIASEFLIDPSEEKSSSGTGGMSYFESEWNQLNRNQQIIVLFVGFLLFLLLVRLLFKIRLNLFRKKKDDGGIPKHKPSHWYICALCRAVIRNQVDPHTIGCSMATDHKWIKLGEVGVKKFYCKTCGVAINTRDVPTTQGCLDGGEHTWKNIS